MAAGENPARLQQRLISEHNERGIPITTATLPSRRQCYNMKAHLKRSTLPSSDAIRNILLKHTGEGTNFCRHVQFYPHLVLIFATPTAFRLLEMQADAIMVDGTFSLCEGGLILTTWMGEVDGVGLPGIFTLSNSRTVEAYTHANNLIRESAPRLAPEFFLVDFEQALGRALETVYPASIVYGDSFHFVHNNQQKLSKLLVGNPNATAVKHEISTCLRILQRSESEQVFSTNLDYFIAAYENQYPNYVSYFKRQWLTGLLIFFTGLK
jgi:hypothetical protein